MNIANWVKCKKTPTLRDKEDEGSMQALQKASRRFKNSEVLKKLGWHNDAELFVNKFIEGTGKDPNIHQITPGDVSVFSDHIKTWEKGIAKGFNMPQFTRWKVLEAKLQHLPNGRELAKRIKEIVNHQRRHIQINESSLNRIVDATAAIGKKFGIDPNKIADLESRLMKAKDPDIANEISAEIKDYLGGINIPANRTAAGDMYLGIRDVMEGMPPEHLRRADGTPWSKEMIKEAQNIRDAWIEVRKDMLKVMINGLRMDMDTARRMDQVEGGRRGLENHLKEIQAKIIELELTAKKETTGREYDILQQDAFDLGLTDPSSYQMESRLGYMPHHILRLEQHLNEFNEYMHKPTAETPAEAFAEFTKYWANEGTPDRAKSRRSLVEKEYSVNPFFFIRRYIHDISRFNHGRAMENVVTETMQSLLKSKDFTRGTVDEVFSDKTIDSALNLLKDISDQSFISGDRGGGTTFGVKASRLLTSLGFIRAMAGSVRTTVKNYAGGRLMSLMEHGYYKDAAAKEYLNQNAFMGEAATRELERYGLLWHRDSSLLKDFVKLYQTGGQSGQIAAATRGAVEEGFLPPGLREVRDAKGNVLGIEVADSNVFEATIRTVEKIAGAGSVLNQAIENALRPQVFKSVFAISHRNLMQMPDWYKLEQMGGKKKFSSEAEKLAAMNAWAIKQAGRTAADAVNSTQFEYADVSKADVLSKHKVVGQFRHYMFELINWRKKTFTDGYRALKAGVKTGDVSMFSNYAAMKAYRMGMGLMLGEALTIATARGFYNVLAPEDWEFFSKTLRVLTANPETIEGLDAIREASYGQGLGSNLGISFNTAMEFAKLMQWVNVNPEDKLFMASFTEGEPLDIDDREWKYRMTKLFNLQAARLAFKSGPDYMDGNELRALIYELGLYTDYEHRKAREGLLKQGNKLIGRRYRKKNKNEKVPTDEDLREAALRALSGF